jgi:hypothetical protein
MIASWKKRPRGGNAEEHFTMLQDIEEKVMSKVVKL